MKQEIGSEFWEVPTALQPGSCFPSSVQWYLSGRVALRAILADCNIRTAALPSWCCDSMIRPFLDAGIAVSFYTVNGAEQALPPADADAILILDYFGYSGFSRIPQEYSGIVIRDLTHSLFSNTPMDADYYFGSLRKWAGFWTGGFAWKQDGTALPHSSAVCPAVSDVRRDAMRLKRQFLSGAIADKGYLSLFETAEEWLDEIDALYDAASRDIALAQQLDIAGIRRQRRENAAVLLEALRQYCIFPEIRPDDCPMFVPVRVQNRDAVRRYLTSQRIYCPVHWPLSPYHKLAEEALPIYREEISLVCDQRYDAEDMRRIADVFREGVSLC